MADFSKAPAPAPQVFKAYLSTVTIHQDRIEVKRPRLAKIGGNRDAVIPIADVIIVQVKDPTKLVNGHVFLETIEDHKSVTVWSTDNSKQVAGNPHAVMFTWQKRDRFNAFVAAIQAAIPGAQFEHC